MSVLGAGEAFMLGAADEADAYVIPKSLRFNSGDSSHLSKTFSSAGTRTTWTWSAWVKRALLGTHVLFQGGNSDFNDDSIRFDGSDRLSLSIHNGSNALVAQLISTRKFRDLSAWYHIQVTYDSSNSTASDRIRFYVNGSRLTDFDTSTYPSQNVVSHDINDAAIHYIGTFRGSQHFLNGYLADIQFVDGHALGPTAFGETRDTDGVWVPKEYSFTSANDGTVWSSSVSNAGGSSAPNLFDGSTSTYTEGLTDGTLVTWSGNVTGITKLEFYGNQAGTSRTFSVNGSDKLSLVPTSSGWFTVPGITTLTGFSFSRGGSGNYVDLFAVRVNGEILQDGLNNSSGYGRNGFHLNFSDSSTNEALGFDSAPTIPDLDPKKGMDVITYTGNGGTQSIGGLHFEPGLIWIKERGGTKDHNLYDSIRGATKELFPNGTGAENTLTNGLTSFNPDGFTLGSADRANGNTQTYVAWTWRAGGTPVTKTAGSTNAEVSANPDYGFSICKYTGTGSAATIEHGLATAPKWMVVRNIDSIANWNVYHSALGATKRVRLDENAASQTSSGFWNDTDPTASVFTVNTDNDVNANGAQHIAYVWSEVSGYSKFSSYTGNGSSTGPVITTGFKVRWLLVKRTDSGTTDNWALYDSERDSVNPNVARLFPNLNNAESTHSGNAVDFLDDGFQPKSTSDGTNANGGNYIYAAFADRPGNNWDVNNIVTNEGLTTSKTQFDVVTYTGNGTTQSITSLAFQPDLVWIKDRSNSYSHRLADSVRGSTRVLFSDQTNAEQVNEYGTIDQFTSNGFDLRQGSNNNGDGSNTNNANMVAWCWKAGGTAVSNTDGSITSSVSANAAYGFSIVTYTGTGSAATVGHGLSSPPSLIIVKQRNGTDSWAVYSRPNGASGYLSIEDNTGLNTSVSPWNSTDPTSSVFSVAAAPGNNAINRVNLSSKNYVAYCFTSVPGYQRVGQYTGNGSGTGPVVVTGFRPRFVLIKRTDGAGSWVMLDSERNPANPRTKSIYAEVSDAEYQPGQSWADFDESSFQPRATYGDINANGGTYIYLAIGDDEIGSDEDCFVDVPNAVTADADETDTTGGYQRGNYCTLNPLNKSDTATISNGNLSIVDNIDSDQTTGTIAVSSGKYYFEATITTYSGTQQDGLVGISDVNRTNFEEYVGKGAYSYGIAIAEYNTYMQKYNNNTAVNTDLTPPVLGDTVGVAFDLDNGKIYFHKNGVYANGGNPAAGSNAAYTGISGTFAPAITCSGSTGGTVGWDFNFGQMRFKYPMPSGYAALNTTALPAATIADGSAYFDVALYPGNGTTGQSITGLEFGPDLVWIKERSSTGGPSLVDTVRGATKPLMTSVSNTEYTKTEFFDSFDSNGFTVDYNGVDSSLVSNRNNQTYVAWNWDGGDLFTNSGYNQSDIWSSRCTGTIYSASLGYKNAFDGSTSTGSHSANGNTITFTPATAIPVSGSIKIYYDIGSITGTSGSADITINGTSYVATAHSNRSNGHFTVTGVSSITSMVWERAADNDLIAVKAIEVDGKMLVDAGVIPVGSLNNSVYNQSQNWTNNVSSTSNITSGHEARLFNGILSGSNADIQSSQGTSGVINFTSAITGSKIEIYTIGNVGQIGINGSNLSVTANQWVDTGVTSLTSVETRHPGAGSIQNPTGLKVDGKILVDSGLSVTNVPTTASTVRANQTAGFSIVTASPNNNAGSIGHGLNAAPSMIISKSRTVAYDWNVYHASLGGDEIMRLNTTAAKQTVSNYFNSIDSFTFSVLSGNNANNSGDMIYYCFAPVAGYSAFGSYTGNGSSSGPFVHTGFRPAFLLTKRSNSTGSWVIVDNKRDGYNETYKWLEPNTATAEQSITPVANVDFLSNGFKLRGNGATTNASGGEYIYWAIAENPFQANGGLAR